MRLLLLVALLLASGADQAEARALLPEGLTPDALVTAADRIRNPGQSFRLTNTLTEYVNNIPQSRTSLVVYATENKSTGQYRNIIRYVAPERDNGKLILMNGPQMWFYDPSSKASVRISPQQRLIGQAADGDVVSVNLARDYRATLVGKETVTDGDLASHGSFHLQLTAANADATYSKIEYWIDDATKAPIKARYYADSGRLLKTAYFRRYQQQINVVRPTEIVILDGVNPHLMTVMDYSDYRLAKVPDAWLQRDYLPYVNLPTQ